MKITQQEYNMISAILSHTEKVIGSTCGCNTEKRMKLSAFLGGIIELYNMSTTEDLKNVLIPFSKRVKVGIKPKTTIKYKYLNTIDFKSLYLILEDILKNSEIEPESELKDQEVKVAKKKKTTKGKDDTK